MAVRPDLEPEAAQALRRRLLYARWLYEKGMSEAEQDEEFSHMVAMMHFHNAIEIVLQNILTTYDLATEGEIRNYRFRNILDMVQQHGQTADPPVSLPARTDVIRLSEMRSNIIHHGQRYHPDEVERARTVCRRFLVDAVRDFFDEQMDTLSMADLVDNSYIRHLLVEIREHIDQDHYDEAVALSALVVELASIALSQGLQRDQRRFSDSVRFDMFRMRLSITGFERLMDKVTERIGEVENRLLLFSLGLDPRDIATFLSWKVTVGDMTTLNDEQRQFSFGMHRELSLDKSDAELALQLATDVALKVQAMGIGSLMSRQFPNPNIDAIGDWVQLEIDLPDEAVEET